jgi:hypothetical protein
LWVPFELGRPLGEPEGPPFQRRVLLHALGLLEHTGGPVILGDFPDDPPGWSDRPGWRPPFAVPARDAADPAMADAWQTALLAEIAVVEPYWRRATARFGRTTVGLFGPTPESWAAFATSFLKGELPTVAAHASSALALRFLLDDLKAFYSEAAQAVGEPPASRQIEHWFWHETVAGRLIFALRDAAIESDNNALKTVGARFFVPNWLVR